MHATDARSHKAGFGNSKIATPILRPHWLGSLGERS